MPSNPGKPRVFVSSTAEFRTLRPRLHERLDRAYEFKDYAEESAGGRIEERLTKLIMKESDVVLGVVGAAYGTPCTFVQPKTCHVWDRPKKRKIWAVIPLWLRRGDQARPACPALVGENGCSIVQWEFSKACEDGLYVIPFLKNLQPEEPEERQRPFIAFLTNVAWVGRFDTEDEALEKIDDALIAWRTEYWGPNEIGKQGAASTLIRICLGVAITCAVLLSLAVGFALGGKLPRDETKDLVLILTLPMVVSMGLIAVRECMELLVERRMR